MPTITYVSYSRLYNLGDYENERITLEAKRHPVETVEQAVYSLMIKTEETKKKLDEFRERRYLKEEQGERVDEPGWIKNLGNHQ